MASTWAAARRGCAALAAVAVLAGLGSAWPTDASDAEATARPRPASPELQRFLAEAEQWLFGGEMAPADILLRLKALEPADRLVAVAYMRRAGIYDGPTIANEVLLAPAGAEAAQ